MAPVDEVGENAEKGQRPFIQQYELKEAFPLFADRKTKLLPLADVPYVLRAIGLTIYSEEAAEIMREVEKVDGLCKPVSLQTLQAWLDKSRAGYERSYNDACRAIATLCHEEIIGDKGYTIRLAQLRHLVSEVGDKIKPETFDRIVQNPQSSDLDRIHGDTCSMENFVGFIRR